MSNLICPSCNKEAFSIFEKLTLGPLTSKECVSCHAMLTVSFKSLLTTLPTIVMVLFSPNIHTSSIIAFGLVGFIITSFLHVKYVPLINAT